MHTKEHEAPTTNATIIMKVLMRPNFIDFPSSALTVEFWMWTADVCAQGTPFSYAAEETDNAFLLYDYTDW